MLSATTWTWALLGTPALAVAAASAGFLISDMEPTPILPRGIASFGAATQGHWLYLFGGHTGKPHQHSLQNVTGEFWRLNLLDGRSWEALPAGMPLQGTALVATPQGPIRIGGMTARNQPGEKEDLHSTATVERFDAAAMRWVALPSLPEPRSSHDAAVIGPKIFVIGGWTLAGESKSWLETAWTLDLADSDPKWSAVPAPPVKRRAAAVVAHSARLFVIGGFEANGKVTSRVDVYDPTRAAWSSAPDLPGDGFGAAACSDGKSLLATTRDGRAVELAADGESWVERDVLAFPRYFHRIVSTADGSFLALGGAARDGEHLRVCERMDPARDEKPQVQVLTFPIPTAARNRQAAALQGYTLTLFGGNATTEQHNFLRESFVSESWSVHLGSGRVERLADLPAPRQSSSVESVELPAEGDGASSKALLLAGGFGPAEGRATSLSDVLHWDLKTRTWKQLASRLPQPRTQMGFIAHGGKLWIFGGLDYDEARGEERAFVHPREVLVADLAAQPSFVASGAELPQPRRAFGGALLDNRYYLVGGMREEFSPVVDCDVFDFSTKTWSRIPPPSRHRISPELVAAGGRLYLCGGSSPKAGGKGSEPNGSIEMYDPTAGAWTTLLEAIPLSAKHIQMRATERDLWLFSTHADPPGALRLARVRLPGFVVSGAPRQ